MKKIFLALISVITIVGSATAQIQNVPTREETVSFSRGDATYSGTLARPAGKINVPLVIMVSGMGPQDRDWTFYGGKYKLAKIISDSLNKAGIAVFRYDDRGHGKSTGTPETLTSFEDLAEDVYAAVSTFRSRKEFGKIGLLGHSLGGILSVMAASQHHDIDFIITLAGSYQIGGDIMMEQAHTLKRWKTAANMTDDEVVANGEKFVRNWVSFAKGNPAGLDTVRSILKDLITYQIRTMSAQDMAANLKEYKDTTEMLEKIYEEAVGYYTAPHQQSFAVYDPVDGFKKVVCPVLVLFGEKDAHVTVASNMPKVSQALVGSKITDFTLHILPLADHAFSSSAYLKRGETVPGLSRYIANWVNARK